MNEQAVQEIIDSYGEEINRLQTELAEKDAKIAALQAQCESYAASLIGERGENAKLRAENRYLQYGDVTITNTTESQP